MCKKIIKKITQIKFPYLDLCILPLYFLTPGIRTCGMCGSRKFCQRGPTLSTFFFFGCWDGERIEKQLKVDHYWPASDTPFEWRFASRMKMAQH